MAHSTKTDYTLNYPKICLGKSVTPLPGRKILFVETQDPSETHDKVLMRLK